MNTELKENKNYEMIAADLIEKEDIFEDIKENNIRIRVLESNKPAPKKGRVVLGECRKISEKTKDMFQAIGMEENGIPDFIVIIYKERITGFTPEQLRILIMHELLHIGVKENSDTGEVTYHIAKHDLEDFRFIIDQYGPYWNEDRSQLTVHQFLEPEKDRDVDPETGEIKEAV